MSLAMGEALVSMLDRKGSPHRLRAGVDAAVRPPASDRLSACRSDRVRKQGHGSGYGRYEQTVDRESAYEKLKSRTLSRAGTPATSTPGAPGTAAAPANPQAGAAPPAPTSPSATSEIAGALAGVLFGTTGPRGGHHDGLIDSGSEKRRALPWDRASAARFSAARSGRFSAAAAVRGASCTTR